VKEVKSRHRENLSFSRTHLWFFSFTLFFTFEESKMIIRREDFTQEAIIRREDFTQEALCNGLWEKLLEIAGVTREMINTDDIEIIVDKASAIGLPIIKSESIRCRLTVDQVCEKMLVYRAALSFRTDQDLTPDVIETFKADWNRELENDVGGRIPFIKIMRAFSGISLKESVEFCERYLYRV
jgi:hypothetical protein